MTEAWETIYTGEIGQRSVRIDRGDKEWVRVVTTMPMSDVEITIGGNTPAELEDRLITYGEFSNAQAERLINKITFH